MRKIGLLLQKYVNYIRILQPTLQLTIPMTKASSPLRKPITSVLFVAAVLLGCNLGGNTQVVGNEASMKSSEAVTVAVAGDWQRPAPLTWSSRFETRWTARWGATPKYIV